MDSGDLGQALPVQLVLDQLLEGDRRALRLGPASTIGGTNSPMPSPSWLVGVDLPGPPGGQDDQGVFGVDPGEQVVDLGLVISASAP
jgi:hypothetical protein